MAQRLKLLRILAAQIVTLPRPGTPIVAIDGVDGAGKTAFADALATEVRTLGRPVIRAGIDGFHNPRAYRYRRGRDDPEGFFEDSFDHDSLRRYLLEPLGDGPGATIHTARFNHVRDETIVSSAVHVPANAVLIFDGIFLHRPELRGSWDLSIFLDVPFALSVARMAARDGGAPDPAAASNRRYVEGQRLYLASCRPTDRATIVVDNSDLENPSVLIDRSRGETGSAYIRRGG